MGGRLVADDAGAIPTIETARVSALADAIVQQHYQGVAAKGRAAEELHASIMALVEPELARYHASRSTVLAQRGTIADLQGVVRDLAIAGDFVPEKRHAA